MTRVNLCKDQYCLRFLVILLAAGDSVGSEINKILRTIGKGSHTSQSQFSLHGNQEISSLLPLYWVNMILIYRKSCSMEGSGSLCYWSLDTSWLAIVLYIYSLYIYSLYIHSLERSNCSRGSRLAIPPPPCSWTLLHDCTDTWAWASPWHLRTSSNSSLLKV